MRASMSCKVMYFLIVPTTNTSKKYDLCPSKDQEIAERGQNRLEILCNNLFSEQDLLHMVLPIKVLDQPSINRRRVENQVHVLVQGTTASMSNPMHVHYDVPL